MFKDLTPFDISNATSYVLMPELGSKARIRVKPANESNPKYWNAMVKMSGQRARQIARRDEITAADADANRDDDRKLFPEYVIDGWDCVESSEHTDEVPDYVTFSKENCKKLCEILQKHLFDRIRNHAATHERFYGTVEAVPDAEDVAKN